MKISTLLELLLVFIIIAFGASIPIRETERKTTIQIQQKNESQRQYSYSRKSNTTEDEYDDDDEDDDEDEDDIFGVGSTNDEIVKDKNKNKVQSHKNQTAQNGEVLDDDDDEDEKDSEEDVSEGEFLLFGDDLFGFFDDSNKKKKNKKKLSTTTSLPTNILTTLSPLIKIKNNVIKESVESTVASNGETQVVVDILNPIVNDSTNKDDSMNAVPQLNLQHTTALLELAQGNPMQEDEEFSTNIHEIPNIYDMGHFEITNPTQNENEKVDEEDNKLPNVLVVKKETLVNTVTTLPTKKPTQKPNDSFLGLVESLISDDDDEKTEEESDSAESSGEGEEEENDVVIKEPEDENTNKNKIKKKKPSGVIESIGESLGLLG